MSAVLILIVIVVLVVSFVLPAKYKASQIAEGNMIQRDVDFAEYGEIFTLKHVDSDKIVNALNQIDFEKILGNRPSINSSKMTFTARYGFSAQMFLVEDDGENMKYRFDFLHWEAAGGSKRASADAGMNLLLTAIEKMFLSLDPNTQVSKEKNTTKRKFW